MYRRVLLVILVSSLLLVVSPSLADRRKASDANDAKGPLDIAAIAHSHDVSSSGRERLEHTVRLFERWPVRLVRHRGFINLFFDTKQHSDGPPERSVYVSYENGRLRAEMVDFSVDPSESMGYVRLRRPNPRTIRVSFPRSKLGDGVASYGWQAVSFIEERHNLCRRPGGCDDTAPDERYLQHDLRG